MAKGRDWLFWEKKYRKEGFSLIAGVDEVGRGPLAGPVVAAVVIFPPKVRIHGINDSKKLSLEKRLSLQVEIERKALAFSLGIVSPSDIDRLNILNASLLAMKQAVENLYVVPDLLLIDGRERIPQLSISQLPIIKGDNQSQSIAAAAILAKVKRDSLMSELHLDYPHFGFASNQGYGTKSHRQALNQFGPCPAHRQSFAPVQKVKQPRLEM